MTMMFIGHSKCKSDSIGICDPDTTRVEVIQDVIWLNRMHCQAVITVEVL